MADPFGMSTYSEEKRTLRSFLASIVLAITVCLAGAFFGMALRDRTLIEQEMANRARTDFGNIVRFRRWNARYGGVFVEKTPGVESNPYLENPDFHGVDGKVYTKKNPALMTREVSEMVQRDQGYHFHITSLQPLNPSNAPDAEERRALEAFARGEKERVWHETMEGRPHLRYMAPLPVEPSCLACHAKQGYRVGDVRGGISVSFDIRELRQRLRTSLYLVLGLAGLTLGLLLTLIFVFFRQLVRRLRSAREQLQVLATTDPLTGLPNRGHLLARLEEEHARAQREHKPLCLVMADVDHFKRVNDLCGHQAGDQVLRGVAEALQRTLRTYDILGRYGGEEFLALFPGTTLEVGALAAERLRASVTSQVHCTLPEGIREPMTLSLGVALLLPGESVDSLLARADQALYCAKAAGRNQVVVAD